MNLTVEELCNKAGKYLRSIKVGNKDRSYTPTGSLQNGAIINTYNFTVKCPSVRDTYIIGDAEGNITQDTSSTKYNPPGREDGVVDIGFEENTVTFTLKTSENIPDEYLVGVGDGEILKDWQNFRDNHIYTKLNSKAYVSISSMFTFLYLLRYFVDQRFCQFTDIYTKSKIWLYKTGTVVYSPSNIDLSKKVLDKSTMDSYINTLVTEIVSRDTLRALKASSSSNSCSSSSSSSSCSSSSSSSSCSSSSSSSSSSLFIAYFNLN